MSLKICTKCKKPKTLEEDFYKIKKGTYYLSECKECFKKRAKKDYDNRGLEHNSKIKKEWCEKHGGKEYYKKVSKEFYDKNPEVVKDRIKNHYHRTKKCCKTCNKIKPNYMFEENSIICKSCLKLGENNGTKSLCL
jgi:hypothetical protein